MKTQRTASWYAEEARGRKLVAAFRRRWWSALLVGVAVVAMAAVVGFLTPVTYSAEAKLSVPAFGTGEQPPGDASSAAKQAENYASIIPANDELLDEVSERTDVPVDTLSDGLTVTTDGTSLLTIGFTSDDRDVPEAVVNAVVTVLTGSNPPVNVAAGSLKTLALPRELTRTAGGVTSNLPVGAVLAVIAAIGVVFALERTSPHVDGPTEVAETLRVPVTTWNSPTTVGVARLVRHWEAAAGGAIWRVVLVGVGGVPRQDLLDVAEGVHTLHRAALEGPDPDLASDPRSAPHRAITPPTPQLRVIDLSSGEDLWPLESADAVVVVVPAGAKQSVLSSTARRLRNQGAEPSWAIYLAPGARTALAPADAFAG